MRNKIQDLKEIQRQIFGKKRKYNEQLLIDLHHVLMRMYGWIPLDEFRKIPMITFLNLVNCINHEKEMEENSVRKMRK